MESLVKEGADIRIKNKEGVSIRDYTILRVTSFLDLLCLPVVELINLQTVCYFYLPGSSSSAAA